MTSRLFLTSIVSILLIFSSCETDEQPHVLLQSMITTGGAQTDKREFSYNAEGSITGFTDYADDIKKFYKVFSYEGPLIVQATKYDVATNSIVFGTDYQLSYFENHEVKEAWFPYSPIPYKYSFTWDGHLVTRVDIQGTSLSQGGYYTIAYDERGNATKIEYFVVDPTDSSKTTLQTRREYEYDTMTNPLFETGYTVDFLIWLGSSSWREAYNTIGPNNITKETIAKRSATGIERTTIESTYTYNRNNAPAQRTQTLTFSVGVTYSKHTRYFYY